MKKAIFAALVLAACTPIETTSVHSRQMGLVVYDAQSAIVPVQTPVAQTLRETCSSFTQKMLRSWQADHASGNAAFFGVMYGVLYNGKCSISTDSKGGSIPEISRMVRRFCEQGAKRAWGVDVTCTPIYHSVPKGIKSPSHTSISKGASTNLLEKVRGNTDKFGALSISIDGAWSIKVEDTRKQADRASLDRCRAIVGRGYESMSKADIQEMRTSCAVIYRFGPDFPGAENITVVKGRS